MRLTVLGTGLIGGSFALAAKQAGLTSHVVGVDTNPEHLRLALERGIIDEPATTLDMQQQPGDLLVLAVGNEIIPKLVSQYAEFPGYIIDVGSVKAPIIDAVRHQDGNCPERFVPCHPVAGSENSGPVAARDDLFKGQTVVITPLEETSAEAQRAVTEVWEACGAKVIVDSPNNHDRLLATTSHLPHLLAFIYESLISDEHQSVTGGGYRDFSRIANSDIELWSGILQLNKQHLLAELEKFEALLSEGKSLLKGDKSEGFSKWLSGL